jgi:hypothetical protein
MDKNLRDIAYFISFCIEQYMNEKNINEDEVVSIFSENNIFDYLNEHYEVLHTQSRQWLIAEIDEIINKSI